VLAENYPLTIVDPAPAGLTRVLALADQLIIVAPATDQAASNLASTQQWLDAHGYGDLAARAVTVINGVRREQMPDVLRAESVARGRCRAIVRVPYDPQLSPRRIRPIQALPVQTRLAYTALAGVVIAGLTPKEVR
jgi:MinD-like ATPase involved in chromosome partitioning or flagellar assembly